MPSEARQKKIMEKLNRAQKCSILGPQNLGSGGGPGPRGPPLDPHLQILCRPPNILMKLNAIYIRYVNRRLPNLTSFVLR